MPNIRPTGPRPQTRHRPVPPLRLAPLLLSILLVAAGCGSCDGDPDPTDTGPTDGGPADGGIDDAADAADGGDTIDQCQPSAIANVIPASDWVRANTDIARYRYRGDFGEDVIDLTLLDERGERLGEMEVRGYFGTTADAHGHTEATYAPAEGADLELHSSAVISDEKAFTTTTELTSGGQTIEVQATFGALECFANEEPPEGEAHPCAWPAPVVRPGITVPSCGFDIAPSLPIAPNLEHLEYRAPVESDPGSGGLLRSTDMQATLSVVDAGEASAEEEIAGWLRQTGADAIIGTTVEQRATAAYSDPAWMDAIEQQTRDCYEEIRQAQQGLGSSARACNRQLRGGFGTETRTRRQGASCGASGADCTGDPHLRTIDGTSYNFQGAGEFILAEAKAGDPLTVQARFEPLDSCRQGIDACANVSVTTAAAMQVGDLRLGVYIDRDPHLVIDGTPTARLAESDLSGLPDGASLHQRDADTIEVTWSGGSTVTVDAGGNSMSISGEFPNSRAGQIWGLWGFFNGVSSDDYVTRRGRQLTAPVGRDKLYGDFGNSWRIRPDESLFDYVDGNDTDTYTNLSFPKRPATLEDLPDDLKEMARAECSDIEAQPDRDWCILDVVCMCDDESVRDLADMEPSERTNDSTPDDALSLYGDVCNSPPDSLAYQPAEAPQCPPVDEPCIRLVREQSGVTLMADLDVDIVDAATYAAGEDLTDQTVSSGTEVRSYLLHLNEVAGRTGLLEGGATFSRPILGVIVDKANLDASDATVGDPDNTYPSDRDGRGIDWTDGEQIVLGDDGRSIDIALRSAEGLDQIRVLTSHTTND
jgi:hypothetical protein